MPYQWVACPNGCYKLWSLARKPQCRKCYKRLQPLFPAPPPPAGLCDLG